MQTTAWDENERKEKKKQKWTNIFHGSLFATQKQFILRRVLLSHIRRRLFGEMESNKHAFIHTVAWK